MIMPREFVFARHFFSMPHAFRYTRDDRIDVDETSSDNYYSQLYFNNSVSAFASYKPREPREPTTNFSEPLELTSEVALDLSFKPSTPITPPSTPSPSSPTQTRKKEQESSPVTTPTEKKTKIVHRRHKAVRKLNFDEEKTSPVSGTIIRELRDDEPPLVVRKGDIDPAFNLVEVTEEAKAELAKIENKIGDYICRLCKEMYEDAFTLAQHRCSRIVHVEYRCPECDKVFNCPANLASHRRWHKPRTITKNVCSAMDLVKKGSQDDNESNTSDGEVPFACTICHKRFRRQAYLRKHIGTHQTPSEQSPTETFSNFEFHHSLLQAGN